MRPRPDESYAEWVERARAYELAEAMKEIANGADVNLVMEAMSARLMRKLIHPLLVAVRENAKTEFDPVANRTAYFENMKHRGPAADHVEEEKIDKSE
jgi:glutamyl-tRNA reductase